MTLLNNVLGLLPIIPVIFLTGEVHEVPQAIADLTSEGALWVATQTALEYTNSP